MSFLFPGAILATKILGQVPETQATILLLMYFFLSVFPEGTGGKLRTDFELCLQQIP